MPTTVMDALVAKYPKGPDIFIHHELYIPAEGWLVVFELGHKTMAAFVPVGPEKKVLWVKAMWSNEGKRRLQQVAWLQSKECKDGIKAILKGRVPDRDQDMGE